jgi:hypothetical protein
MGTPGKDDLTARALARNDRFLLDFVERLDLCPFARECRESGGLDRRILASTAPDENVVLREIADLHRPDHAAIEVALFILPLLDIDAIAFERFAARLREATAAAGLNAFFIVAFHPDAPFDASTPARLVPLFRRSPDPTLQLVRVATLERVRRSRSDTVWVDTRRLDMHAPLPASPPSMSERIAEADAETARRIGIERLVANLAAIRKKE